MASEMGLAVFVSVVGDSTVSHPYHNCVQHVNNGYTGHNSCFNMFLKSDMVE